MKGLIFSNPYNLCIQPILRKDFLEKSIIEHLMQHSQYN